MRTLWLAAVFSTLVIGCSEGSRDDTPSRDQNPWAPKSDAPARSAQPVVQSPAPPATGRQPGSFGLRGTSPAKTLGLLEANRDPAVDRPAERIVDGVCFAPRLDVHA